MNKFLHYFFGLALVIYAGFLFVWCYESLNEFLYSINHITNPMYFARIFSPIITIYLGVFYLYCAIKNKINLQSRISLFVLVLGLLISMILGIIDSLTSTIGGLNTMGGHISIYSQILNLSWRILIPLSIFISIIFSFISIFKKINK